MKKKRFQKYHFLGLFLLLGFLTNAQEESAYKKEVFVKAADSLPYRILYPQDFSEDKTYPLVLFLHGAGERGNDNEAQLAHGGDLFLQPEVRENFPAIVVFPQAPKEDYWAQVDVNRQVNPYELTFKGEEGPTVSLQLVMALLDTLSTKSFVDNDRIYVGGLSMGGMGTYELLQRRPDTFAASFVICGAAEAEDMEKLPKDFNIWIFHGEQDDIISPEYAKTLARVINSNGANAKLSLYPNDNHNSWDSALAEPYLLPWLFSNVKNDEHENE